MLYSIGLFVFAMGLIGMIIFSIMAIFSLFRKNGKAKRYFIIVGISLLLFIVGAITGEPPADVAEDIQTANEEKEEKAEQKKIEKEAKAEQDKKEKEAKAEEEKKEKDAKAEQEKKEKETKEKKDKEEQDILDKEAKDKKEKEAKDKKEKEAKAKKEKEAKDKKEKEAKVKKEKEAKAKKDKEAKAKKDKEAKAKKDKEAKAKKEKEAKAKKAKEEKNAKSVDEKMMKYDVVKSAEMDDGELTLTYEPGMGWSENSLFRTVYDSFEVTNQAFKDDSVDSVVNLIKGIMVDQKGNEELEDMMTYRYYRSDFEELNYSKFKEMAFVEQWRILNEADGYFIHPGIRVNLKEKYTDNLY